MVDGDEEERGRGILAPVDREFLTGEQEYNHRQTAYNRRTTLQERVINAILDFTVLYEHLDDADRMKLFKKAISGANDVDVSELQLDWDMHGGFISEDEGVTVAPTPELEQGMIDAVAFLWLAALDAGINPVDLMETGIKKGFARRNPDKIASPELNLNAEFRHSVANQGAKKMRAGEDLSEREVYAMLKEDRKSPETVAAYLRGAFDESQDDVIEAIIDDSEASWEEIADRVGITAELVRDIAAYRQEELDERLDGGLQSVEDLLDPDE